MDAPVEEFGDVEDVFGGAGDLVDPAELLELLAGFAEDSEDLAVEREFVDAAGEGVGGVEDLVGAGGDADGPGCAGRIGFRWRRARVCGRWRVRRWRSRRGRRW